MNDNEALIERFYTAFARRDHKVMAQCYSPDAVFEDEVFNLQGKRIAAMWHMLCAGAQDFSLEFSDIECDQYGGTAHWEPQYRFSATGRMVHNIIESSFRFRDGQIVEHIDSFNFWRWSRQALGVPGLLLGWSRGLRSKVQVQAALNLDKFIAKNLQYQDA
jgi:ketosteroid isomerase-like protein